MVYANHCYKMNYKINQYSYTCILANELSTLLSSISWTLNVTLALHHCVKPIHTHNVFVISRCEYNNQILYVHIRDITGFYPTNHGNASAT